MKQFILFLGLITISLASLAQSDTYCDRQDAMLKCKKALVPFRYNNSMMQRVVYTRYNQVKQFSIPLYQDYKTRFVFNTENIPEEIKIEIYDSHSSNKKRTKLFESSSTQKQFTFEPDPESGIYAIYVELLIPATISESGRTSLRGCVVIMSGFEDQVSERFGSSSETGGN